MEQSAPVVQCVEIDGIRYPPPIRKFQASICQKRPDSSLAGLSNQKTSETKSSSYRDNRYTTLLAAKGSYMKTSNLGITEMSRTLCTTLLDSAQSVPEFSLFQDDIFEKTCLKIKNKNEARIIQDITPLIVPSAETLATYGSTHLEHLIENVDEAWTEGIPIEGPRPQPNYSVGFRLSAFTKEQSMRLRPLVKSVFDASFFVATYRMYFPFLACGVKRGAAALEIADRQNAHSMTLAVRGVVELFRLVQRERELHREILAFSVSHDPTMVRIYGHYPVIDGKETTFYRHPIRRFSFTELDGREKWSAYKFTKNVYDIWMPNHLKRICSVVDQLPRDVNFEVQGSDLQFAEASELSRDIGGLLSDVSNGGSALKQGDNEMTPVIPQTNTPDTSVSQASGEDTLHRLKRKYATK